MKAAQIVLIEDNPADVLLVEMALKESGVTHEMTKFRSGEEALRALCPPEGTTSEFVPDAILLDLNTPKSDGFQVLIKLKQSPRLAHVPMAVITSSQATSDKYRTGLQGTRYIQKPTQLEEFLNTVGQAVKEMIEEGLASKSP
jgi:chemotaxis family two-component system response regulator Rcp1